MRREIAERVVSYLDSAPTPTVPLSRVYSRLVAEVGRDAGSYGQLRSEVARRSDLFLVLEPRHPFSPGDDATAEPGRLAYETAVVESGHDCSLRIALADAPTLPPPPFRELDPTAAADVSGAGVRALAAPLDHVDASLVELWRATPDDPVLRADLAEALSQTEELRAALTRGARSTSHPRGPRT